MFFDSGSGGSQADDELLTRLVSVPIGHHYLILYSDIQKLRKVCSAYVKGQIEKHPKSIIVILPYYDTTDKVRAALEANGINVKEKESHGEIIIVDIEKVINKSYYENRETEKLRIFTKDIESKAGDKTVFVIADMSVFHHLRKGMELLDYERELHKDLQVEKWKELCLYNRRDFDRMFSKEQSNELLRYHDDRVLTV